MRFKFNILRFIIIICFLFSFVFTSCSNESGEISNISIDENEIIDPDKQEEGENYDSEEESNKKKLSDEYTIDENFCYDINFSGIEGSRFVSAFRRYGLILDFFLLDKDNYITYKFPKSYEDEELYGLRIEEIAFEDINLDGLIDVVIIITYFTGIGQTPYNRFGIIYIYRQEGNGFVLDEDLSYYLYGLDRPYVYGMKYTIKYLKEYAEVYNNQQ